MSGAIRITRAGPTQEHCLFPCQGGAGECAVPIAPARNAAGASWALLSGEGQPVTLDPSIDCKTCGFHGFIRDGQIEVLTPGDPARYQRNLDAAFGDMED